MSRFTKAGIMQLLACIPVLIYASAVVRAGNIAGAIIPILAVLAVIVASSVLCFSAEGKASSRLPATILCGIVFAITAVLTVFSLVNLAIAIAAPEPSGILDPSFSVTIYTFAVTFLAPIAILSGISTFCCVKALRADKL